MTLPHRFPDRDEIAGVRLQAAGLSGARTSPAVRRVAGRVTKRRGHGRLAFVDLTDRSGTIQLYWETGVAGPADVNIGDILGVEGKPMKTRRGEPSLRVLDATLLAPTSQLFPSKWRGVVDSETRYRKRYLDLLVNEDARRDFLTRSAVVATIRRYLDERGFVEVETPILQPRYGGALAEPFVTYSHELGTHLYLRIADELYLKRLIVGGLEKVYEIGKDFRNESISYKHQPEFTMLEWYEAYADYEDTMARIEDLVATVALEAIGKITTSFRGQTIDLTPPWRRLRLIDSLEAEGVWTRNEEDLRGRLEDRGVDTRADATWGQLVDHALSHLVEPKLIDPTILFDYPVELSPLARLKEGEEGIVERFEYFAGGMELGNAYSELNDAEEQSARFAEMGADDPDYIEALSYGMPPTAGLGLGIDRLAMLLTSRETIRDVILFPALSAPTEVIDLALPDRWWRYPLASLVVTDWWERHVLPAANELLSNVTEQEAFPELIVEEARNLRVRQLGPYPPEWRDYKALVTRRTAAALQAALSMVDKEALVDVRPEIGYHSDPSFDFELRGTANGLATLAAIRAGRSPSAVLVQNEFLAGHAPETVIDRRDTEQPPG